MNMIGHFNNYVTNIAGYCYSKTCEVYKYAPPIRTIAIRAFRGTAQLAPLLLLSKGITQIAQPLVSVIMIPCFARIGYVYFNQSILGTCREWTLNKLRKDQSKNNVLIFCRTARDFSGAISLSAETIKILKEFSKTHSIILVNANDMRTLNNAIRKTIKKGKNITTLWISCHGYKESMQLGNEICDKENPHS